MNCENNQAQNQLVWAETDVRRTRVCSSFFSLGLFAALEHESRIFFIFKFFLKKIREIIYHRKNLQK
jgi:hypothetical protein